MTIIKADFGRKNRKSNDGVKKKKPAPVYQLHVSLAFSDPLIWRRILVPGDMTLQQLHEVLLICMGWSGGHRHKFYVGKIFYEMSSPTGDEREYDEAKFELQALEEAMKWCFTYLYDAEEGWEHDIVLEEVRRGQTEEKCPVVLDGQWASPPEDIGGVHSYIKFCQAIDNPDNEKSSIILKRYDLEHFDPATFEQQKINEALRRGDWGG